MFFDTDTSIFIKLMARARFYQVLDDEDHTPRAFEPPCRFHTCFFVPRDYYLYFSSHSLIDEDQTVRGFGSPCRCHAVFRVGPGVEFPSFGV